MRFLRDMIFYKIPLDCVGTHLVDYRRLPGEGRRKRKNKMQKDDDRHLGRRENIWFPFDEHAAMLAAMEVLKEQNKSNFIRSAVRNFIKAIKEASEHGA